MAPALTRPTPTGSPSGVSVHTPGVDLTTYARKALKTIEKRALYLDDADWPQLRDSVLAAAATAQSASQVHEALRGVLHQVGGAHSFLIAPSATGSTSSGTASTSELPTVRAQGAVGVLRLPTCFGERDTLRAYIKAGGEALRAISSSQAWVVDLRDNEGGTMWPMLAVVAPLLGGDGVLGSFTTSNGKNTTWSLRRGRVKNGWIERERSSGPRTLPGPVAVLTGPATASSGEAVAISFRGAPHARSYGTPTRGLSTANEVVQLEDGASMAITTATMSDRHGVVHDGPVRPDVPVDPPDDALDVALADLARATPEGWAVTPG